MVVHEWAGLRVSRQIAGAGQGLWRCGRLWVVVVAAAVVIGACLVMLVTVSAHADRACTARCSQFEGGMVAGGSRQVYLVVSGGEPGMPGRAFSG
jgi:hypothetical protein